MTYDPMGNLLSFTQSVSGLSNGSTMSNVYTYTADRISTITHNGFTYDFEYDLWGNRTKVTVGNTVLSEVTYDSGEHHDHVSETEFANGQNICYTYDTDGRISAVTYDDETSARYQYVYGTDGELEQITNAAAGLKTVYTETGTETRQLSDSALLFSTCVNQDGETEQYFGGNVRTEASSENYDPSTGVTTSEVSQETAYVRTEQNVDYDVSISSDMTVCTDWFGRTVSKSTQSEFSVDDGGSNGTHSAISSSAVIGYDDTATTASTRVTSYSTTVAGETVDEHYEYDTLGNVSGVYRYVNNVKTYFNRYYYDEAGQLTREDNRPADATYVYTYDVGGNIVSVETYAYTEGSLANETPTETKSFGYGDTVWKDKLTSIDNAAVTTDALGNVTALPTGETFEWTGGRQLAQQTQSNGKYFRYSYTSDGMLSGIEAYNENDELTGGYSYYWNGDKLECVTLKGDANNVFTVRISYDSAGEAQGFTVNDGMICLYRKNYLGDITGIYMPQNGLTVEYSYDAWGNPTVSTPEGATPNETIGNAALAMFIVAFNPLLYRGYLYTPVTGFSYYLGSRFYVPSLHRFLNADVYEDTGSGAVGTNMFAYCNNNPTKQIDPNGKSAKDNLSNRKTLTVIFYNCSGKESLNSHVEVSFNSMTYTYGTNGASYKEKLLLKANGVISICDTVLWTRHCMRLMNYTSDVTHINILLSITEARKWTNFVLRVLSYIIEEKNGTLITSCVDATYGRYYVLNGKYKIYNFLSSTCTTFVVDCLSSVLTLSLIKKGNLSTKLSPHALKTLLTKWYT